MFCENCGGRLKEGSLFCENCGYKVEQTEIKKSTNSEKKNNKSVIVIIIIFVVLASAVFAGVFAMKKVRQNKQEELKEALINELPADIEEYESEQDEVGEYELEPEEEIPVKEELIQEEADYSYIDVETQVSVIREEYNQIVDSVSKGYYSEEKIGNEGTAYYDDGELKSVVVPKGENGIYYTQYYYYQNGQLMFAYYEDSDSHRFYFYENQLMRWRYCKDAKKSSEAVNYDWDDSTEYNNWEREVYSAGNTYL